MNSSYGRHFPLRWIGVLLFIVTTASIACGQETNTPLPVEPAPSSPTVEAPSPTIPPTISPTEATVLATPRPVMPLPAVSAPTVGDSKMPDGTLRVIDSGSSSSTVASGWRSAGSFRLSPSAQDLGGMGGLTVSAVGSVTVAADEAYVIIVAQQIYGPSGSGQITSEDRRDIVENLADVGIEESAVEFGSLRRYGPSHISVELDLEELLENASQVIEAVEEVIRRSETSGVRYTLTEENCDRALALARRQAIPSVEKAADDLADALDVVLGNVTAALEYPLTVSPYGNVRLGAETCGNPASDMFGDVFGNLVTFDSEQEVEVSVGLQVTYSIR